MGKTQEEVIETVEKLLASEDGAEVFERLGSEVYYQISSDEKAYNHMGRNLWAAYKRDPALVDDVLMALCGWSMKSLLIFAGIIRDDEGLIKE